MGLEIGLGILGAAGAAMQGIAGYQMSNYQAQVAENNKRLMEYNAQQATLRAGIEAEQTGMRNREQQGKILAIQGASGLAIGQGTTANVLESAQVVGRMDQLNDIYRGAVQSTDFRNRANAFGAEAGLRRMAAAGSLISGALGFGRSLLGTGATFSSKWADMVFSGSGMTSSRDDFINAYSLY
jgi:hypothetical protein